MTPDQAPQYTSGDLTISPELGVVRNARGESARLGPINMKVLALLLSRSGQVVRRDEIFAAVWPSQLVSDDVLTRSISDIRARLAELSRRKGHIETVPKRGYRWIAGLPLAEGNESEPPLAEPGSAPTEAPAHEDSKPPEAPSTIRLAAWPAPLGLLRRGVLFLAAFLLLASAAVWLADRFTQPAPPVVAVLPTEADPRDRDMATLIEQRLTAHLIATNRVDLLARSAVETRPSNPFPYFYSEFGARWLVESQIREIGGEMTLVVTLVDARSGILLYQLENPIAVNGASGVGETAKVLRELDNFIASQLSP